jgi:hypothetical protein
MRQDQYEKLQALSERLTDTFLEEGDPDRWPGHGIEVAAMDKQTRGDRYWCKKNAVATLSLIDRVGRLTGDIQAASAAGTGSANVVDDEGGLDADILQAEKEAAKLLDQMTRAAAKKNFDQRVHGKG